MEGIYGSPLPLSQRGIQDGSDGATANFGGSPSTASTTPYFDARPSFAADSRTPRANAQYAPTQLVPFWDSQQHIRKPIDSFLRRLKRARPPDEKHSMKTIHTLWKRFKRTY